MQGQALVVWEFKMQA